MMTDNNIKQQRQEHESKESYIQRLERLINQRRIEAALALVATRTFAALICAAPAEPLEFQRQLRRGLKRSRQNLATARNRAGATEFRLLIAVLG